MYISFRAPSLPVATTKAFSACTATWCNSDGIIFGLALAQCLCSPPACVPKCGGLRAKPNCLNSGCPRGFRRQPLSLRGMAPGTTHLSSQHDGKRKAKLTSSPSVFARRRAENNYVSPLRSFDSHAFGRSDFSSDETGVVAGEGAMGN